MTVQEFITEWNRPSEMLQVHTSGSTGEPKTIAVEKKRMEASARMTCDFLGLKSGDSALLCMSLDYIGGKMMVVRSLVRNLRLISVEPSGHPLRNISEAPTFAAMVPLQVYNSLKVLEERKKLLQIKHLIIGGGAVDEVMAETLKSFPHAVWSTYGMTETLSHIAMRRLNGPQASVWYQPLEHVQVHLNNEGCLVIEAPAICSEPVVTNDLAELFIPKADIPDANEAHMFRILGRKDSVINSGGIKIQMEDVERKLQGKLQCAYQVSKAVDEKFGETVVLLVESTDIAPIKAVCEQELPKYWQPRFYLSIDQLPMTETGKPARAKAIDIVREYFADEF